MDHPGNGRDVGARRLRYAPMSDQQSHKPDDNLREISHLFLSSIRDKAGNGAARPQRTPPGQPGDQQQGKPRPDVSLDLTPEEFAQVFGGMGGAAAVANNPAGGLPGANDEPSSSHAGQQAVIPPVVAIIGAHLNGR